MSDASSDDKQFAAFIDRILRCREAEDEAKDETKAVYAEMKGEGYEKAIVGALVMELRKKGKDAAKFEETETVLDLYRDAYERASHTHTRARATIPAQDSGGTALGESHGDKSKAVQPASEQPLADADLNDGTAAGQTAIEVVTAGETAPISNSVAPISSLAPPKADEVVPAASSAAPILNERCKMPETCKFGFHPHKITCATCSEAWMKRKVAA